MERIFYFCKIALLSASIGLISPSASAQQAELDSLHKKFDRYRINLPQEKLYVHTDQELYLTGESLWFKIYYVDGALHHPMDVSKVAYFEILDADNRPVLQTKIALKDGEGNGSLFLPATINSGNYNVRAYTQWMKNFSPEYFFHKRIGIINSFRKLEIEKVSASKPFVVQFFPEGGNLVYGLKSKVAFQATNMSGKGINFSGLILNEQDDTIAQINPYKFGIGNFIFTPHTGSSYRAILTDTLGKTQTIALPVPRRQGFVIEVKDSSELLVINVFSNMKSSPSNFYYFIHARQIISASGMKSIEKGGAQIMIPKRELNEGISHITIFDGNLQPQCERLYFKPSDKKLPIEVKTSQQEYGMRRKVILDIYSPDVKEGEASLSVAVVKTDSLQQKVTSNIFDYLWLGSDLKGEVESPGYYQNTSIHEVSTAVDNLMLTHGWRRFSWDNILTEKKNAPTLIPEYRGHLIRGIVLDASGKPAPGISTYLSSPGKNIQLYTARSKSNGEVQYEMKDFWGPKKIIVQPNIELDSAIQIKVHSPYADVYASRNLGPLKLPAKFSKNLLTRSIAMQVQDIYYRDHWEKFSLTSIDSTAFYGKASETYFLEDYTRFTVMEEVMREYVPGVMVRKKRDGFHFLVLDNVRKSLFQDDPLVLLDGTPIFDIDKIMEFDPLNVKKLEVLTHRYYLGPSIFPGIVSYTTFTGDLSGFQLDPKTLSIDYEGLQRQRVFYSPQYENQKQRESRIPDRRNLLCWEPQVVLDKDGRQQLEFFTSDLAGEYTIVIEGMTKNGASGSTMSTFIVKQFNN
jgi:hypothetical protein